jgi:hypothetical protein
VKTENVTAQSNIKLFYNRERFHSADDYLSLVDFEMQLKSALPCVRKSVDTSPVGTRTIALCAKTNEPT